MNLLFLARNHELRYSSRSLPSVPLKKTGTRVPRKTEDANSNPYGNIMHDNQHSAQETKRRPVLLHDLLGMEFLPSEPGRVRARLKVEEKVCQISGFMSGGAALALAETLAGFGSLELLRQSGTSTLPTKKDDSSLPAASQTASSKGKAHEQPTVDPHSGI